MTVVTDQIVRPPLPWGVGRVADNNLTQENLVSRMLQRASMMINIIVVFFAVVVGCGIQKYAIIPVPSTLGRRPRACRGRIIDHW